MDDEHPTASASSDTAAAAKAEPLPVAEAGDRPESATPATGATGERPESATPATDATPATVPPPLDLNELQAYTAEQLDKWSRKLGIRLHPGRSRHHQILDLVRTALNLGGTVIAEGFLDEVGESFGFLRSPRLNFLPVPEDVCVSRALMQRHQLRPGQQLAGTLRLPREREKFLALDQVRTIEGQPVEEWSPPTDFEKLTPQFPQGRIMLENPKTNSISARAVDLIAPLGHGQRGLIVSPPRVGKTILLKEIANEHVHRHVQVAELVLERAKRLVELKKDVVILLDSITRLSRGYNNLQPSKGRIMSGGVESKALTKPKKFFGSARNAEEGGSLTILATALTETGSRMDEVIFEEFKGTGNMELHLDRALQEKRLYPAIHPLQSATRREELLYHPDEWERVQMLRKTMAALPPIEAMEKLIENIEATKTNAELLLSGLR